MTIIDVIDPCNVAEDWHHVGNQCLKYIQEKESWRDARQECQDIDADLVIINNTAKMNIFQEIVNCKDYRSTIWLGLSDTV